MKPSPPAAQRSRHPILLVDDHPMTRFGLATLIDAEPDLRIHGQAATAEEALTALARSLPDLVITDLNMPGRGGLELIKDLKALYPTLPTLVISMQDELLHAERALRAGARGYLMKEAGGEKILEAIRAVLAGQIYVSQNMSARILDIFSNQSARHANSPIQKLTDREFEVFQLIGQGQSTREIARRLNLSSKTVDVHRGHIKEKLQLTDATALVRQAVRWVEASGAPEAAAPTLSAPRIARPRRSPDPT